MLDALTNVISDAAARALVMQKNIESAKQRKVSLPSMSKLFYLLLFVCAFIHSYCVFLALIGVVAAVAALPARLGAAKSGVVTFQAA